MPFLPPASTNPQYDRMSPEEKKRFHEEHGGNWDWGGAAKGAATGAGAGFMVGGPWGALAGGLGGGFIGGRAGAEQKKADAQRRAAMDEAIASQAGISGDLAAQQQQALDRTMGFYGPAMSSLEHLYGIPASAWGQGVPGNRPPGPGMRSGALPSGMPVTAPPLRTPFAGAMQPLSPGPKALQGLQRAAVPRPPFRGRL